METSFAPKNQMKKPKILVKYPSRQRPDKFFATLDNIGTHFKDQENYKILVSLDTDDDTMRTPEVLTRLKTYLQKYPITVIFGESKSKIDAVNRDINDFDYDWDIVLIMSDDMLIVQPGIDEYIRGLFLIHFPNKPGAIHLNDGYKGKIICTVSLMNRPYYNKLGKNIYFPDYDSFCSDDDFTEQGYKYKCMVYEPRIFIRHEHPANNKLVQKDELYEYNDGSWKPDSELLKRRRSLGFPYPNTLNA